jgi:hypothetical protein
MALRVPWLPVLLVLVAKLATGPAVAGPQVTAPPLPDSVPAEPVVAQSPAPAPAIGSWVAVKKGASLKKTATISVPAAELPNLYEIAAITTTGAPAGHAWYWLRNGVSGWVLDTEIQDPADSIVQLNLLISRNPQDPALYIQRGKLQMGMAIATAHTGRHELAGLGLEQAIADFDDALKLDAKDADAYFSRGRARSHQGDWTRAIADFTQAIALDLAKHETLHLEPSMVLRGVAYRMRGCEFLDSFDIEQSITDLNQALTHDPMDALAYQERLITLGVREKMAAAERLLGAVEPVGSSTAVVPSGHAPPPIAASAPTAVSTSGIPGPVGSAPLRAGR